jgi:hypothetical protein
MSMMKINNKDLFGIYCYLFENGLINGLGDCQPKSLENFIKMRNGGAVRVRGLRATDRLNLPEDISKLEYENIPYHYWVERKGKVFNSYIGKTEIMDIDEYYQKYDIKYIEKSSIGLMDAEMNLISGNEEYKEVFRRNFIRANIDTQNEILIELAKIWSDDVYADVIKVYENSLKQKGKQNIST